jgi:hypothetical protein
MEAIQKRLSHRESSHLRKLYGPKLYKISKLTSLSWSNGASYALSPREFPTYRSFVQAYLALQLLRLARTASGSPCGQVQLGTNKMTQMHGCFMWGLCLQNWLRYIEISYDDEKKSLYYVICVWFFLNLIHQVLYSPDEGISKPKLCYKQKTVEITTIRKHSIRNGMIPEWPFNYQSDYY